VIGIRGDSPRWTEINASAWEHERAGLRHIKGLLPDADPYLAWANVEFVALDGSVNEVDLLVLTPSGLYLLELKHWQGEIRGDGTQWVLKSLTGRTRREDNPLILANRKAKRLATLLRHYAPQSGKPVQELKFGEILPPELATRTLAARLGDRCAAHRVGGDPVRWSVLTGSRPITRTKSGSGPA